MSPVNRSLIGLGIGLAAAGAATGVGIVAGRATKERHARLSVLAPEGAYAHTPDKEFVVVADDGVRLHVEVDEPAADEASPDKPTVVFSHGFCLSHQSWVLQRKSLIREGYRVVAWDQRGHGASGRGSEESCLGLDHGARGARKRPRLPVPQIGLADRILLQRVAGERRRRGSGRGVLRAGGPAVVVRIFTAGQGTCRKHKSKGDGGCRLQRQRRPCCPFRKGRGESPHAGHSPTLSPRRAAGQSRTGVIAPVPAGRRKAAERPRWSC